MVIASIVVVAEGSVSGTTVSPTEVPSTFGDVLRRVVLSGLPVAFVLRMKVELPAVPTHGWPLSPVLLMDHRREPSVRE